MAPTTRRQYGAEKVQMAMQLVEQGTTMRGAARIAGVPKSTLLEYVKDPPRAAASSNTEAQAGPASAMQTVPLQLKHIGHPHVLSPTELAALKTWFTLMADRGIGVTKAFALDKIKFITADRPVPSSWNRAKGPGRQFFRTFLKDNPDFVLRVPA